MDDFDKAELARLDRDAMESERLQLERERVRLQRIQLAIQLQQSALQRRAYKKANRSWYERVEDALFDW